MDWKCVVPLLLFLIGMQIPFLVGQFGFPGGDQFMPTNTNGDEDELEDPAPKPGKWSSKFPGSSSMFKMNGSFNMDSFMTPPDWLQGASMGKFIFNALNLFIKKGIFFSGDNERSSSPFDFQPPDKVFKGTNLSISEDGESYDHLLTLFETVMYMSPHRAHPWYLKRDAAGMDPYALASDIISVMHFIDCSGEQAPLLVVFYWILQRITIIQLRILIGYIHADGILVASPHIANLAAVQIALAVKLPKFGFEGFLRMTTGSSKDSNKIGAPSILISEGNRDSLKILGVFGIIPEEYLVKVKMDSEGRMDPKDLEKQIKKEKEAGRYPFMVIASLGTTNLGAVDPIPQIVTITEKYDLWLHLDGQHGGPCLFVKDFKEKWPGIDKSDSLAFSFSSLLGAPQSSSYLMTRNEGILMSMWSIDKMYSFVTAHAASQLFHNPKFTDSGKAFGMWLFKGNRGLRQHVTYAYKLTNSLREKMKTRKNYKLLTKEADTPAVPFNVIPAWDSTPDDDNYVKEMDKFTKNLQQRLIIEGFIYITITRSRPNEPKHFIISTANSILTEPDLDYILDKIDCHAKNIVDNKIGVCTKATWKRVGAASPLAASEDGYAPYVNSIMPDLHLPLFKALFQLFVDVNVGFDYDSGKSKSSKALDLALDEYGLKQSDIKPYMKEMMIFIKNVVTLNPTNFKMMDKTIVVSIVSDFVVTFMAPAMDSYEEAPPFMLIKEELEKFIRTRVGYADGKGDGTVIPPDGIMDPMFAINLAKYNLGLGKKDKKDSNGKPLVLFISKEAHFSWRKAAATLGIGFKNCHYVDADESTGKMNPKALREAIEASFKSDEEPFMVVGTLGTDVLGAVDPMDEIAAIATEFGIWFHVDARNGGPTIFSDKERKKWKGIEKSDSFSFGPSKFYRSGSTDPFSVLVTRKEKILQKMMRKSKKDEDDDSTSLNTGRRSDEFKFWIMLKSEGMKETAQRIERILKTTQKGIKKMQDNEDHKGTFKLILEEFQLNSICFQYLPKKYSEESNGDVLDKVQIHLESVLRKHNISSVYYTNATVFEGGKHGFMKIDVLNPDENVLFKMISQVDKFGVDLEVPKNVKRKGGDDDDENPFSATVAVEGHEGYGNTKYKGSKKSKKKEDDED